MDAENSHMTDRILDLTLEIVYLLTGEKCAVVKMVSIEGLLQGMYPPLSGERSRSLFMDPPPLSLISEKNNDKRILEVTRKIIELLTGEMLLEECRSVWKKVTMENRQDLTSPDLWGTAETVLTSNSLKEESYPREGKSLFEERVHEEVDSTVLNVKEEDSLDEDSRAQLSAKSMESSPQNADTSESERWPPTSHIKEEMKETDSASSPVIEKFILEDSLEQNADMSFTSSPAENKAVTGGTGGSSIVFGDGKDKKTWSSIPPQPPHRTRTTMIFNCDMCQKVFSSCSDFLLHQSTCQGPLSFFCGECGKCFGKREQLVRHRRIHTGLKCYTCPECEKSFRIKSQLVAHRRVHTGEKPFSCAECGRSFARRQLLESHKVIHSGERPFACSECQMTFSRTSHLIIHRRIHSGEKPYSCSECNRSFRTRSSLIAHQRTHTGERPYHCLVCGKCYTHSSHLIIHQRSHSGERPYSCLECGKSFPHKSGLVRHQQIHTRQRP